ncbi:hypothetical protein VDGL01_01492 [Verticillium dahliae]
MANTKRDASLGLTDVRLDMHVVLNRNASPGTPGHPKPTAAAYERRSNARANSPWHQAKTPALPVTSPSPACLPNCNRNARKVNQRIPS